MSGGRNISPLGEELLSAQVGVLGSMLLDGGCVSGVLSRVSAQDFYSDTYRSVFQAVSALFKAGMPVDAISVREKLGDGWSGLLAQILDATPTAANVDGYITLLKQSSTLFRLQELGLSLSAAATLEDAWELVDRAMALQVGRPGIESMTFSQGFDRFFSWHDGETAVDTLEWDIPELNTVLKIKPGNMVVIGGYPSDGKTSFALQCAARFGLKHRVGFFSYESTLDQLFDRHVSRTALLSSRAIADNALTEEDYRELLELRERISAPQVTIVDAAGMSATDIQAYSQTHHFDVIVVDYLQKIAADGGYRQTEFDRVSEVSSALQQFAKRTKTRVVALSQLSRPDKGKDGKIRPPTMGDLRSSGQIEQDADVVLLIYREDYQLKDSNRILQVAKNRNGEAFDRVRCRFDGDHQTFVRIAPMAEAGQKREKQPPRQVSFWADGSVLRQVPDGADNPFAEEVEK